MELARKVQVRLFPRNLPTLETLTYAGVCMQARQLGGDYYDFLNLGCGYLGLVVGDVVGRGIAAALLMASLQASLRSQCALALDDIGSLLRSVNRAFCENTHGASYATLFFAEYSDEDQRVRYANCGHPAPLLLHADNSVERLGSTATVLGLWEDWDCSLGDLQLVAGDTLVLYTDGITEAMNEEGEEFGEHRLIELLRRHSHLPASDLLRSIVNGVRRFAGKEFQDDITLVAASCARP
jgi:serine phosphatase RsbU (regulator of sigma subunit)